MTPATAFPTNRLGAYTVAPSYGDPPRRPVTAVRHVREVAAIYGWTTPVPWSDNLTGETREIRDSYALMTADDAVKSALSNKVNAVASLDGQTVPENPDDPEEVKAAECCQWALAQCKGGVPRIVRAILSAGLVDGYSLTDPVFPLSPCREGRWAGYKPLKKVSPKKPSSYSLVMDDYLDPAYVRSNLDPGQLWPVETFLFFTNEALYDDPFGASDLRAAYRYWLMKDALWKARGLYSLKLNGGLLVGEWDGSSDRTLFESAIAAARGAGYIVLPPGCKINLVALGSGSEEAFARVIADLDKAIVVAIQGAYLHMLEGQTPGGRGASFVHGQTSDAMKWMLAAAASAVISGQLLPKIMAKNFRGVACPYFFLGDVDAAELKNELDIDRGLLRDIGLKLSASYLYRKYRRPPPKDEKDAVHPPPLPGQPGAPGVGDSTPQPGRNPEKPAPGGGTQTGGGGGPKPAPPPQRRGMGTRAFAEKFRDAWDRYAAGPNGAPTPAKTPAAPAPRAGRGVRRPSVNHRSPGGATP